MIMDLFPTLLSKLLGLEDVREKMRSVCEHYDKFKKYVEDLKTCGALRLGTIRTGEH